MSGRESRLHKNYFRRLPSDVSLWRAHACRTCAARGELARSARKSAAADRASDALPAAHNAKTRAAAASSRSEERRVGKECRCRWSAYAEKNKYRKRAAK